MEEKLYGKVTDLLLLLERYMSYTYVKAKENNKTEGTAITIYNTSHFAHSSQQNNALTVKVHSAIFTFYLHGILVQYCFCSITYILWLWHYFNYRCQDRSRKVQEKSGLGPRGARQDRAGEGGDQVPVWESEAPEGQGGQWQGPGLEGLRQYQERENGGMQRAQGSQVGNFARSQCSLAFCTWNLRIMWGFLTVDKIPCTVLFDNSK